jgi:hypothetical protein
MTKDELNLFEKLVKGSLQVITTSSTLPICYLCEKPSPHLSYIEGHALCPSCVTEILVF